MSRLRACAVRLPVRSLLALLVVLAACTPQGLAKDDIQTGQAMVDLSDALGEVRDEQGTLQAQVDSLRLVVARQDTVLRQLANLAGVSMPMR
ncbi:MAG: hypothetical protein MUE41_02170 [Gemmatimonadaceae bacterium]|jgi:hypothetical protein|nr:hypothetical protein [Gemmatimonadaceae bacterium]